VVARARSTLNNRVRAWPTFNSVYSVRTDVIGGEVFACAPSTNRIIGASEGVVAVVLAPSALGKVVEAEAAFQPECGGEGRQARSLSDVLCLWSGDGYDDGGGRFSFASFV
jgi:hypothetical protein